MTARTWKEGLARTRRAAFGRLGQLLGLSALTPEFWQELEAILIQGDLGPRTAQALLEELKQLAQDEGLTQPDTLRARLHGLLLGRLPEPPPESFEPRPHVVALVGVNGSGKTTTAARLARRWQTAGARLLLAAADTYRAAAAEQLAVWGERLGIEVIQGQPGGDPGAVAYDAAQSAKARGLDGLLVDTSGRMHTRHNLMAELQKVCRATGKVIDGAPHQVLLVLDATTGQNGLAQARAFTEAVNVTGVVLAKLDSSARGGVALAVAGELGLPICYVGLGEGLDDLARFDPAAFVNGLLAAAANETG
ncbi:MAG: signal recognition particle-docking protein FtsY [Chloroflexi bacterium RBG_13_68_17]|nr:MAG: signal recognition particle-docking protein FtsY [Chloroflexi bacterium RBG_13_68_17]